MARAAKLLSISTLLLLLAACVWTSDRPLMMYAHDEAAPVSSGTYDSGSGRTLVVATSGPVARVQTGGEDFSAIFDQLDGDLYVAEVVRMSDHAILYAMIQPRSDGFAVYQFSCEPDEDETLAMQSGATVSPGGQCVFSTYDQVLAAMRAVAAQLRADPTRYYAQVFRRRP
jgi:hypothetical protein